MQGGKDAPIFRSCSTCFDYGETLTTALLMRRTQKPNSTAKRHREYHIGQHYGTAAIEFN
jgi:hypothetical protein